MKNLIIKALIIASLFLIGSLIGTITKPNPVIANSSCDTTTCENDLFGGYRCFQTQWNRTCNDGGYPDCFDISCTAPDQQ